MLTLSMQLLVVRTADWTATTGTLTRYTREGDRWVAVGASEPVVVGKGGLGWGIGLHPAGLTGPTKQEGDGRAPAGVFALGDAMGVAAAATTAWPYKPTAGTVCVDDKAAAAYNDLVPATPVAWSSAEQMVRKDWLYDWLVVVDHNPGDTPGAGSCIFLHVWRAQDKPTVGCTASRADVISGVIGWLDPAAHPVLVQLPQAEYDAHRADWGLP